MRRALALLLSLLFALTAMYASAEENTFSAEDHEADRAFWLGSAPADRSLSAKEQAVDALLADMKAQADTYYTQSIGYGLVTTGNPEAAESDLFAFCKALPKGGELHSHDFTAASLDSVLDLLINYRDGGVAICLEEGEKYGYLYAPDVEADVETMTLKAALEEGALTREQIHGMLSVEPGQTPRQAWDRFGAFFRKTGGLSNDSALVEPLYENVMRSCVDNGVTLIELRTILLENEEDTRDLINAIKRVYYSVKAENPEFTVRIIGTSSRNVYWEPEIAEDRFRTAIRLSREILDDYDPDEPRPFIIGLDLVGEEDIGRPLSDFSDFLLSDEVQGSGLQLFLHCGESLRLDNEAVVDAYLLGARRLGHGYNLYRYPKLLKALTEGDVALEVCPVSNCLLGYATDLRLHTGQNYLRSGVPTVLCSDDAIFMENAPLTEDYFAAILSWNLTLGEVKTLAENSILYSGLSEAEVNALHEAWLKQWDAFIDAWSQGVPLKPAA